MRWPPREAFHQQDLAGIAVVVLGGASADSRSNWPQVCSRMRHSSIIIFRRTSERTRANSARSLTGLVRKSSAPASRPRTRSAALGERRHHDDGNMRVRGLALMRRQTSNPSMPGIMTSSRTMSGVCFSMSVERFGAAVGRHDVEILGRKLRFQQADVGRNIVDDQNARGHGLTPTLATAGSGCDGLQEIDDGDRLGDVGLAAALADLLLVALHRERRHRDDREWPSGRRLP